MKCVGNLCAALRSAWRIRWLRRAVLALGAIGVLLVAGMAYLMFAFYRDTAIAPEELVAVVFENPPVRLTEAVGEGASWQDTFAWAGMILKPLPVVQAKWALKPCAEAERYQEGFAPLLRDQKPPHDAETFAALPFTCQEWEKTTEREGLVLLYHEPSGRAYLRYWRY